MREHVGDRRRRVEPRGVALGVRVPDLLCAANTGWTDVGIVGFANQTLHDGPWIANPLDHRDSRLGAVALVPPFPKARPAGGNATVPGRAQPGRELSSRGRLGGWVATFLFKWCLSGR